MSCLKLTRILLVSLAAWFINSTGIAVEVVPEEVKKYVAEKLPEVIMHLLNGTDDPSLYGFDKDPGDISFGPLHEQYSMMPQFIQGESPITPDGALTPSREWITAVYQNGTVRNAVGIWQKQDGTYEFSTTYNRHLGLALETLQPDEKLFYEFPKNAWYALTPRGTVRPVDEIAKSLMPKEKSLAEFRSEIQARYRDVGGETGQMGGAGSQSSGKSPVTDGNLLTTAGLATALVVVAIGFKRSVRRRRL